MLGIEFKNLDQQVSPRHSTSVLDLPLVYLTNERDVQPRRHDCDYPSPAQRLRMDFGDDGLSRRTFWNSDQRDQTRHLPSLVTRPNLADGGNGHTPPLSAGPSRTIHRIPAPRPNSLSPHLPNVTHSRVDDHTPYSSIRPTRVASYPFPQPSSSYDHPPSLRPQPALTAHRSSDSLRNAAEIQRSSHLPPSLAALRLEGPVANSYGLGRKVDSTLPSLEFATSPTTYIRGPQSLHPPPSSSSSTTLPPLTSRSESTIPSRQSLASSSVSAAGSASTSRLPSFSGSSSRWQSPRDSLVDGTSSGVAGGAPGEEDFRRKRLDLVDGDIDMDDNRRRKEVSSKRPDGLSSSSVKDYPGSIDGYGHPSTLYPGFKYDRSEQFSSRPPNRPWQSQLDNRLPVDGQTKRRLSDEASEPTPRADGLPRFKDMFK